MVSLRAERKDIVKLRIKIITMCHHSTVNTGMLSIVSQPKKELATVMTINKTEVNVLVIILIIMFSFINILNIDLLSEPSDFITPTSYILSF